MIRAYKLYTSGEGQSHVVRGHVADSKLTTADSFSVAESPAYSLAGFHNDSATQYVITLSGAVEFETQGGDRFTVRSGEVLIVMDNIGLGHKWRLVDDQPWKRAYVVFNAGTTINFSADDL